MRVAIVGAGISGLALAEAVSRAGRGTGLEVSISVLEGRHRAGGYIHSETIDGYLCEHGPSGFLDNAPSTLDLVRRLDLQDRLLPSADRARRRFVYRKGRLHEVPESPLTFFQSSLLSWPGKLRVLLEPLAKGRPNGDESVHAFAARRIGTEAADVLISAMVLGIVGGDARQLSLKACFPRMWEFETTHRSLFRALIAERRRRRRAAASPLTTPSATLSPGPAERIAGNSIGTPSGRLTSFVGGMEDLVRGLLSQIGQDVHLGRRVSAVRASAGVKGFLLQLADGPPLTADAVVLSGPAHESAELVASLDPALRADLGSGIRAPLVVVALGYDAAAVAARCGLLDGFGFLVPRGEGPRLLGVLWDSSIYPGRAPAGRVLLRAMIGGAQDPSIIELTDGDIVTTVRADLRATMGLDIDPVFVRVFRHPAGLPQYTIGHLEWLSRIDARLAQHPRLYVTGNSYRGVAVSACIADAGALADRVIADLRSA